MTKPLAKPPSRVGKKPVTAYVTKDLHRELRILGIQLEKSSQEMLTEALREYLAKHAD
ncbi:MAG: hypothetical protein GKR90_11060 [Pseudomonadales bacterium]|nr:hypothetical protein [Pseudomonadales bacterium]